MLEPNLPAFGARCHLFVRKSISDIIYYFEGVRLSSQNAFDQSFNR